MELLAKKIEERFALVAEAYGYFASFSSKSSEKLGSITLADFSQALDSLRLNLHHT